MGSGTAVRSCRTACSLVLLWLSGLNWRCVVLRPSLCGYAERLRVDYDHKRERVLCCSSLNWHFSVCCGVLFLVDSVPPQAKILLLVPPDFSGEASLFLADRLQEEWNLLFENDRVHGGPLSQRWGANTSFHTKFDFTLFNQIRVKGNYSATMQAVASCDAVIYIPYDKETMVLRELYIMNVPLWMPSPAAFVGWFQEDWNICSQRINWLHVPEPIQPRSIPSPLSILPEDMLFWMNYSLFTELPYLNLFDNFTQLGHQLMSILLRHDWQDVLKQTRAKVQLTNVCSHTH